MCIILFEWHVLNLLPRVSAFLTCFIVGADTHLNRYYSKRKYQCIHNGWKLRLQLRDRDPSEGVWRCEKMGRRGCVSALVKEVGEESLLL